jgi:lipopolysaccharide/colanic/teichoic acid biosynthesis glycosyltransferase
MRTLEDGPVIRQARQNDPRLTRVGRFLRRWNIDEVPQLFNVLTGDMSLVGPRPHALSHDREYEQRISRYARRHNVKPGITSWAQIHGYRGETDTDEKMRKRVEHDLYYIDNWSLWLDFKIIVRTVLSRSAYRNAYRGWLRTKSVEPRARSSSRGSHGRSSDQSAVVTAFTSV